MERGDFITISYTGRIRDTNTVFDTTHEEVAVKEGIATQKAVYGPVTVILGEGHVISGLEKVLLTMDVGEEKQVDIPPEEAFGKRDKSLVVMVPLREFRKHKLSPRVGMRMEINDRWATVRSVSSGRVTLDFNHPLSGKVLQYSVKVLDKVEDTKKQIEAIITLLGMRGKVVLDEGMFSVSLDNIKRGTEQKTQNLIRKEIEKYAPRVKVSFH